MHLFPQLFSAHGAGEELPFSVLCHRLVARPHDMIKVLLPRLAPMWGTERELIQLLLRGPCISSLDLLAMVTPLDLDCLTFSLVTLIRHEHIGYRLIIVHGEHEKPAGGALQPESGIGGHGVEIGLHAEVEAVGGKCLPAFPGDGDMHLAEPPHHEESVQLVEHGRQLVHRAHDVKHDHGVQCRHGCTAHAAGGALYAGRLVRAKRTMVGLRQT